LSIWRGTDHAFKRLLKNLTGLARYIERAEDTARFTGSVNSHSTCFDLAPLDKLGWSEIIAITGTMKTVWTSITDTRDEASVLSFRLW